MIRQIVTTQTSDLSRPSGLRNPARVVTDFGKELETLLEDLDDTLRASKIAVGLAAPQIGSGLRVAAINIKREEPTLFLINPVLLETSGKNETKYESCMSLPHLKGRVERRHKALVSYKNVSGEVEELHATGFLARVVQHEIDHLDGKLYADRVKGGVPALENADFFTEDEQYRKSAKSD